METLIDAYGLDALKNMEHADAPEHNDLFDFDSDSTDPAHVKGCMDLDLDIGFVRSTIRPKFYVVEGNHPMC